MITRRRILQGAAALGTVAIFPLVTGLRAQDRPFTFVSWGGALSDAEKMAFMDPYSAKTGKEIVNTSPTNYAKLKAMVESDNVEWDLVDVGGRFIFQGSEQGLLEKIDYDVVKNAAQLDERWVTPYGVYTSAGATIIAWNTDAIPKDAGPTSWKDFWDVQGFPGARGLYKPFYYNYEAALLAAGLDRSEIYPVTDEKVQEAFGKIKELKPHITVWWSSGAQPPQLLSSGELALSSAWSGRMIAVEKEGAPTAYTFKDGLAWGNAYVVPMGTPYENMAMEVINYCLSKEAQMRLLDFGAYGPVLEAAAAEASPEQARNLVMYPDNIKDMLILDEEQAALYSTKYEQAWNELQLA